MMTGMFSTEELIAALVAAQPDGDDENADARTAIELRKETGIGLASLQKRLRMLVEDGRVECVRKQYRRIDGVNTSVVAYRWLARNE